MQAFGLSFWYSHRHEKDGTLDGYTVSCTIFSYFFFMIFRMDFFFGSGGGGGSVSFIMW